MTLTLFRDVERQATRMGQMMRRLKVNTLKIACADEGKAYVEARITCFDCGNSTRCLAWLDARESDDASPTFCPNLQLFEECKMGQ